MLHDLKQNPFRKNPCVTYRVLHLSYLDRRPAITNVMLKEFPIGNLSQNRVIK
jgi:hypothetical protein